MSDAARYMEYAIKCAHLLNGAKDVEMALQLLGMAQAWKGLALQTLPSRYPDVVGAHQPKVGASFPDTRPGICHLSLDGVCHAEGLTGFVTSELI